MAERDRNVGAMPSANHVDAIVIAPTSEAPFRVLECDRFSCRQKTATAKAVALQISARFWQNLTALLRGRGEADSDEA